MKEKRFIILHRILWSGLALLIIIFPHFLKLFEPEVELVKEDVYVDYSYSTATVDVELQFSHAVSYVDIWISFYDENDNLITEDNPIYSISEDIFHDFVCYVTVGDKTIEYYEITQLYFNYEIIDMDMYYVGSNFFLVIFISLFIMSFFLKYKEYIYENKVISVYAGWYRHYLKINGEKVDEFNGGSFMPIFLNANIDENTRIDVIITRYNGITFKINGKLCNKNQYTV